MFLYMYTVCTVVITIATEITCISALNLRIGLLLPIPSPQNQGIPNSQSSGGAVLLALKEARKQHPDINITLIWKGQRTCDEYYALIPAFELAYNEKVDVIIGPACWSALRLISRILNSSSKYTLPQVTWLPGDTHDIFPNASAISTYGEYGMMTNSIATVLRHFKWNNIGIISSRNEMCDFLLQNVNDNLPNQDFNIRGFSKIETPTNSSYVEALKEMKDRALIILLCLPSEYLQDFLLKAEEMGFASGKYVFIYCTYGPDPGRGLSSLVSSRADNLLSILLQLGSFNENDIKFSNFTKATIVHDHKEISNCCGEPDEYALLVYETVLAVVESFTRTRANLSWATYQHHLAGNFSSVYGSGRYMDQFGKISRTMQLSHYQNGRFEIVGKIQSDYTKLKTVFWMGKVPKDSPECGWGGSDCTTDSDSTGVIAGSVVAGVVGAAALIFLIIVYRKFKFEKELLSMIWKVNSNEIRRPRATTQTSSQRATVHPKKKLNRADTRGTLGLGSTSSIDRNVLYAPVGNYKGSIVAVKNIQRRSIHLTRDALKDLKTLRELQHENINPFLGANLEPHNSYILTKYCAKGSLQDVLENDDIQLDYMFQMSFTIDLARGLDFLHRSPIRSHGNLKSSNCVIDSRWVLKLTDFGALVANVQEEPHNEDEENEYYSRLLWTAPELLRMHKRPAKGTQKGDVYSFGIIEQEILLRCNPYYYNEAPSNKVIINRIRNGEDPPYRPRTPEEEIPDKILTLIYNCWQENPDLRMDMHTMLKRLIDINGRRKINIMDNMIKMLEAYSNNLEDLVAARTDELAQEKQKTDILLYQMLPPLVAEQLKRGEHVRPETYDEASLFFSDIVGFTTISSKSTPLQVIDLLNDLYTTFDGIIGMHDVYKVETIGDAYMCASGIPRRNGKRHAGEIANMALDLLNAVTSFQIRHMKEDKLQLRIGLHTGACAAGVVGLTMPRYCLFGDTVNMASRMESTGKAFHIHVSSDMREALQDLDWGFMLMQRGIIEVKGKGQQMTYWLVGKRGFSKPLPEDVEVLRQRYKEAETLGRPLSPTESHISAGSQSENTSMYGNAFRRASIALTFLHSLPGEHLSYSANQSHSASELSVKDIEFCDQTCNELKIPGEKPNSVFSSKRLVKETNSVESCESQISSGKSKRTASTKKSSSHKAKKMQIPTIEIS